MPFNKEWDSKVKVFVFPFKINKGIICHNCECAFEKEHIKPCTGLCQNCVNRNSVSTWKNPTCDACEMVKINPTNFGISRQLCITCRVQHHPLKQRCIACDTYSEQCWNHICSDCRTNKYLCDETGYFYSDMKHHFHKCWCLSHVRQQIRAEIQQKLKQRNAF